MKLTKKFACKNTITLSIFSLALICLLLVPNVCLGAVSSLIGQWAFDEGQGITVTDTSGNNLHGTITGATWVDGKFGNALNFDGNDSVKISHNTLLDSTNAMTIEAWINPSTTTGGQKILSKSPYPNNDYSMTRETNNRVKVSMKIGGVVQSAYSSANAAPAGTWTHVVGTYDGVYMKLFINGKQVNSFKVNGKIGVHAQPLMLGSNGTSEYYKGMLDGLSIYNRALTADEILSHYQAEPQPPVAPSPILQEARTTKNGNKLCLHFDKNMAPLPAAPAGFNVTVDGKPNPITAIYLISSPSIVEVVLANTISRDAGNIELSYQAGTVKAADGGILESFIGKTVRNMSEAVPVLDSTIEPKTEEFDKKFTRNITIGLALNGNTLLGLKNGTTTLINGTDYTIKANNVTINKTYLLKQPVGICNIVFYFSAGNNPVLPITITDSTPSTPVINGLIGQWAFDEGQGITVTDTSGNNLHGTITGATWVDGKFGNALNFDGNDSVKISHNTLLDSTNAMTIEAWINPSTTTGGQKILSKSPYPNNDYSMTRETNNRVKVSMKIGGVVQSAYSSANAAPAGTWTHVVGTYDGVYMKLFINGKQVNSFKVNGKIGVHAQPLMLGSNGTSEYYKGMLDGLSIYNRALTADEILSHYQAEPQPPVAPSPILQEARTTKNGNKLCLHFDKNMAPLPAAPAGFNVTTRGDSIAVKAVNLTSTPSIVEITLDYTIYQHTDNILLSYQAGTVKAADGGILESFTGKPVINESEALLFYNSTIAPKDEEFDKNHARDITVILTLNGNTLFGLKNGETPLLYGTDYTVQNNIVTIKKRYLLEQPAGPCNIIFDFNAGNDPNFPITITDNPAGITGLVGQWTFDDVQGTTVSDSSGYEIHGTINGATLVDGKVGKALSFDGNDSITIPHRAILNPQTALTVEALANPSGAEAYQCILTKSSYPEADYRLLRGDKNNVGIAIKIGENISSLYSDKDTLPVGEWTHIAATYDGNSIKLFINGVQSGSMEISGQISAQEQPLMIGASFEDAYFTGMIDEISIYNTALTAKEILEHYDDSCSFKNISITDSVIHPTMPIIYSTDKTNKKVYAINYETRQKSEIAFDYAPISIAYANDEIYVALLNGEKEEGAIAIIDANNFSLKEQFDIDTDPYDIVVGRDGYIYVPSGSGQWTYFRSYSRTSNQKVSSASIRQNSYAELHPTLDRIYTINTDLSPRDTDAFNISNGIIEKSYNSPYHGDYPMEKNIKISPDGKYLFNGSGLVLHCNEDKAKDMLFAFMLDKGFTDIAFDPTNNTFYTVKGNVIQAYDYNTFEGIETWQTRGNVARLYYQNNTLIALSTIGTNDYLIVKITLNGNVPPTKLW